jgi:aminoglycoside/choline kinase family phosphotransferase
MYNEKRRETERKKLVLVENREFSRRRIITRQEKIGVNRLSILDFLSTTTERLD